MTKQLPNPCCRCGFCCIGSTCPVAQYVYKIHKDYPCPGLAYDPALRVATCNLNVNHYVGVGTGCCISARCFKDGVQYDFASRPVEMKKNVALSAWRKKNDKK
jgi:hypothetical protein